MHDTTDEEIARAVQEGHTESFGILVERYEQKITRYARKFFSNREDVKDLVQDVFLKTYENIRAFDPELKFSPWIYRIAHNEFINELRRKKNRPVLFDVFESDTFFPHLTAPETAEGSVEARELKDLLDRHLAEIDVKYREPMILYYFDEMNYQEISEVLRIPASTVGVRLLRGKEALKKIYEKNYGRQ